jgi:hypothetical protein
MSPRTTLLLLVAVLLLGGLAYWQLDREGGDVVEHEVALFPGVDPARVVALRIEQQSLDAHVRIERQADGSWRITDPEDVPADPARVHHLLGSALPRKATPVPAAEADAEKLGLEPPRAVLEVEEDVGGTRRRTRLEIGAIDPDQQRVNVRAGGRLLRTYRDLDTTLARPPEELRSHRVLDVDAREVVELHRRGSVVKPDGTLLDVHLDALAEEGVWRATAPMAGALDPMGMSLIATGLSRLTAKAYLDFGAHPLAQWGLDPPEATLVVSTPHGVTRTLRVGRAVRRAGEAWACTVEGRPYVYGLDPADVDLLFVGVGDLLDHRLWRVARQAIEAIELESAGRAVVIERARNGWTVRGRRAGEAELGEAVRAETARVEDLLAKLEGHELDGFDAGTRLPDAEIAGALHVRVAGGERLGGVLSAPEEVGGVRSVRFRRDGDEVVGRSDAFLHDVASTRIETLHSLMVQELVEVEQRALRISDGGRTRTWTRGKKGQWVREGGGEARELVSVLDHLLFLRAERHLVPGERTELLQSLTITFVDVNDTDHVVVLALGSSGELEGKTLVQVGGRVSIAREQGLHGKLSELLAP